MRRRALAQKGQWTIGFLGNYIESFAGDDDRKDGCQEIFSVLEGHLYVAGHLNRLKIRHQYQQTEAFIVPLAVNCIRGVLIV
jgi:hypothetical protein